MFDLGHSKDRHIQLVCNLDFEATKLVNPKN